jgi:hypothetical protein
MVKRANSIALFFMARNRGMKDARKDAKEENRQQKKETKVEFTPRTCRDGVFRAKKKENEFPRSKEREEKFKRL